MNHRLPLLFIVLLLFCCAPLGLGAQQDGFHADQLYVRLDASYSDNSTYKPSARVMNFFSPYRDKYGIQKIAASFYFSESAELRRTFRITVNHPENLAELIRQLEQNPEVEYAEKIPLDQFYFSPNDMGPNSNTGSGQWYLYKIRASQAWDIQRGKSNIKVAVVDDAVQVNHTDLAGVCLPGRDVAEDRESPAPPDSNFSHGTHVAGIIAANTDNNQGIASIAHGVSIIPIKITLNGSPQTPTSGYEGIAWATAHGADVINVSWGSVYISYTAQTVTANAVNAGIVVVAAAGNSDNPTVNYPAGYPGVISVANTNNVDKKSGTSSFGNWIDVSAPGDKIRSTIPFDKYGFKSGTSFAAPMVSALAALILSTDSNLTRLDVENCIKASADNIDALNPDYIGQLGSGRINAEKALACAAARSASCEIGITDVSSPVVASCNNTILPAVRITNYGTDTVFQFKLNYKLNNEYPKLVVFNDTLAPGKDTLLILPELQATIGSHTLQFSIQNYLNGDCTDAYPGNNLRNHRFEVFSPLGRILPFNEDFESNTFQTNQWLMENPGSDFAWEITTTGGLSPGNKSARLAYYLDDKVGERDYLTTPPLNFSGYSAINMSFKHAYTTRGGPAPSDSFFVSISTDCGLSWTRLKTFVETGSKTFSTRVTQGLYFTPEAANEWCGVSGWAACTNLNLNAYKGMAGVRIRFEGYNKNGNNIYIDNISITGTPANIKPESNFSAAGNESICEGQSVQFTNLSLNQPTSLKWHFEGGSPDSSDLEQPLIQYLHEGKYPVRLIAQNASGKDTLIREDYIEVKPAPDVSVIAEPDSICKGASSLLIAGGGDTYIWSPANSLNTADKDSVIATPTASSSYTVQVLTQAGCTGSGSVDVHVFPPAVQPSISQSGDTCVLVSTPGSAYVWYYNGLPVEGAHSSSITATQPGNYNVKVTNDKGCTAFSAPFRSNCTAAGQALIPHLTFGIAPNPFSDFVVLSGFSNPVSFSLYSLNGGELVSPQLLRDGDLLHVPSHLPSGIYLLKATSESETVYRKLVKIGL